MPRNLVPNHFDKTGIYVDGERSVFRFSKPHLSSFMSGMLVPLGDPIPVFPGEKFDLKVDAVIRSNTMVCPPLDGLQIDFISVWVPHRIVWSHMPQFLGDNDVTAWTQSTTYQYPYITLGDVNNGVYQYFDNNSPADESVSAGNLMLGAHYGLYYGDDLTGTPASSVKINVLAFRGYYMSWNYLFRDENYQRPVLFSKGDTGSAGEFGYKIADYLIDTNTNFWTAYGQNSADYRFAVLMPVNKYHNAYTSVLPDAQFGSSASVFSLGATAPVYWKSPGNITGSNTLSAYSSGSHDSGKTFTIGSLTAGAASLYTDLQNATATTINQLRTSIMYQRYLEALGRIGRRPNEYMQAVYGLKNTNMRFDYPELLMRSRYTLGVTQVAATADGSGSGWSSHLGDTGAYSLSVIRNIPICNRDFSEFGYIHIFYCVRSDSNRWSQIIQPHFTRIDLLDEYNPYFDHIGEVAIPNTRVNVLASAAHNWGYQEAWFDIRSQLGLQVGAVNKLYGSLKYWTAGEAFNGSVQTCTPDFLVFKPASLDDFFVSRYYAYPQFIGDFMIYGKQAARMSAHSIPGIVGRI